MKNYIYNFRKGKILLGKISVLTHSGTIRIIIFRRQTIQTLDKFSLFYEFLTKF